VRGARKSQFERENVALLSDLDFNGKNRRVQSRTCDRVHNTMSSVGKNLQSVHSQSRKFGNAAGKHVNVQYCFEADSVER
jgi:hypothetical protein